MKSTGATSDATCLDPESWDEFRRFLRTLSDDAVDFLSGLREGPVWRVPTAAVVDALEAPIPEVGLGRATAYQRFNEIVLPHLPGNLHPRFWGWVIGSGAPSSMVGAWLAALTNGVPTIFNDSSLRVERQVLAWLKSLFGMPEGTSGILTTGVSEATLIALTAARYRALGPGIKDTGVTESGLRPVFYLSDQTHDCARKAIEILGFGRRHMHMVSSVADDCMNPDALAAAIDADVARGRMPLAVVATLGAVNTGAADDLDAIANVCRSRSVWLHVDGAFGAWTVLTESHRRLSAGVERADSLVFDMHKWMYQTYDIGCVLIRDGAAHKAALETGASYLSPIKGGLRDAPDDLSSYAIQLSRGFRALKIWFALTSDGVSAYRNAIEQNLALADYLRDRIDGDRRLERLAAVPLHIVNFRYIDGVEESRLDVVNEEIVRRLHIEGIAVPSPTFIRGRFSIRVCISNHRTRHEDIDLFLSAVLNIGRQLEAEQFGVAKGGL